MIIDYQSDSKNSEFSFLSDNSNVPSFVKEFDFLSKKKIRELSLDTETIDQELKKVFLVEKESEKDEIIKEKEICEKQNSKTYFDQSTRNSEKTKNEIKSETEFSQISLSEKEIEERESKKQKGINQIPKKIKFEVKTKMVPGKKITNKSEGKFNKKIHTKNEYDSIITHVQVDFIKFIINLSNDILTSEFGKNKELRFKDISYKIKRKINFDYMESLKNSSIKNVILNPVSHKFKGNNENYNEIIYNKVINSTEWLKEFFNMNFLSLFKKYYFNKYQRLNQITIKGKVINLSNKTNTFYELYKKNNDEKKKLLIKYINKAYFGIQEMNEENNSKTIIFLNFK